MDYGIQLYSIRDLAKENFEEAVAAAARIGYASIEFAGFFGRSAEEVNRAMDAAGIRICGTHSPWADLANDYENTLRFHKEIGNKNIIQVSVQISHDYIRRQPFLNQCGSGSVGCDQNIIFQVIFFLYMLNMFF